MNNPIMSNPKHCNCEIIICTPDLYFELDCAATASFQVTAEEPQTEIQINVGTNKPQNSRRLLKQNIKPTINKTIAKKPKRAYRNKYNCEVCNNDQNIGKYCFLSIPRHKSLCSNCLISRATLTLNIDYKTASAAIALIDFSEEPFVLPSLNYNMDDMLDPNSTPISGTTELHHRSNVADKETPFNHYAGNMREPSPGPSTSSQNTYEKEELNAPKDYTFNTLNKQQKLQEISNAIINVNSTNEPGSAVKRTNLAKRSPNESHAGSNLHYFINLNHISGGYLIDNSTNQFIRPETNSEIYTSAPVTNVPDVPNKTVPLSFVPNGPFTPVPVTVLADGPYNPKSVLVLGNEKHKRVPVKIAPARPGVPYTSRPVMTKTDETHAQVPVRIAPAWPGVPSRPVTTIADETHKKKTARIAPARRRVPYTSRPVTTIANATHTHVPLRFASARPEVSFTHRPDPIVADGTHTNVAEEIAPARHVVSSYRSDTIATNRTHTLVPEEIAPATPVVPVIYKPDTIIANETQTHNDMPITIIPTRPCNVVPVIQYNQELSYCSGHSTEYLANLKPKLLNMPLNTTVSQNTIDNFQPRKFLREPVTQSITLSEDVFNAASIIYSFSKENKMD